MTYTPATNTHSGSVVRKNGAEEETAETEGVGLVVIKGETRVVNRAQARTVGGKWEPPTPPSSQLRAIGAFSGAVGRLSIQRAEIQEAQSGLREALMRWF